MSVRPDEMLSQAGWNGFVGQIWPEVRSLETLMYSILLLLFYPKLGTSRAATSSSFRGGAIFMKFHSMMSSRLFNHGTNFSQTS